MNRAALTCDLAFLHSEGNDQAEGAQDGLHPVHSADGIIGGLNQSQKGGALVSPYWELWDIIQREEEEEEGEAQQDGREAEREHQGLDAPSWKIYTKHPFNCQKMKIKSKLMFHTVQKKR